MNDYALAWAAGFFDGEGNTNASMHTGRSAWALQMSVTQIHKSTLLRFQEAVEGLGTIYGPYETKSGVHPQWTWKARSEAVVTVFELLQPYLSGIKIDQANLAISRWESTRRPPMDLTAQAERRRTYKREWQRRKRAKVNV